MQNYVDDKSILAVLEPTFLKISIVQSHNLTNTAGLQYDGREHSRRITKEMQNCVDEKSILAVLEQIHSKLPIEQRKLWETVGDETKVGGSEKKGSLLHSWHSYGSGALIGINFRPQTAEK